MERTVPPNPQRIGRTEANRVGARRRIRNRSSTPRTRKFHGPSRRTHRDETRYCGFASHQDLQTRLAFDFRQRAGPGSVKSSAGGPPFRPCEVRAPVRIVLRFRARGFSLALASKYRKTTMAFGRCSPYAPSSTIYPCDLQCVWCPVLASHFVSVWRDAQ